MNLVYKTVKDPNVGFLVKSERDIRIWYTWFKAKPGDVILTRTDKDALEGCNTLSRANFLFHMMGTRNGREISIQRSQ